MLFYTLALFSNKIYSIPGKSRSIVCLPLVIINIRNFYGSENHTLLYVATFTTKYLVLSTLFNVSLGTHLLNAH